MEKILPAGAVWPVVGTRRVAKAPGLLWRSCIPTFMVLIRGAGSKLDEKGVQTVAARPNIHTV